MAFSWRSRRRALYVGLVSLLVLAAGWWSVWQVFFSAPPSCTDGKQNQGETGVDCGGPCALLCASQTHEPVVLWTRAFLTASSTYTAAAYVQNSNVNAGAHGVGYRLQLFDAANSLVVERDGVVDLPPLPVAPVVLTGINVGTRDVARALFTFSTPPVWQAIASTSVPRLSVRGQSLAPDGKTLSATIRNDSIFDAPSFTVAAVLFDAQGGALAASVSRVSGLAHLSSTQVVFTWPTAQPTVARAEVTVLPPF